MNKDIAERIFSISKLEVLKSFKEINIGYTNKVYLINNKYILKVCEDLHNEVNFEKEIFFYDFFKNKIPVPKVIVFDKTKKIYDKFYMIYEKIQGDNLYSLWHLLTDQERKQIIKESSSILRIISESPFDEYTEKFNVNPPSSWHDEELNKINQYLSIIENKRIITPDFIQKIKDFVNNNHQSLIEQKIALVFWDAHFDNVLVKNNKIVGILDFERTELASLDYNLDVIKRMVDYPKKYMSEAFEKFAKKEDYANLLIWFKEFYPSLFDFKHLDKRLDLYAIEHDLNTLIDYPNSDETKQMIAKTVNFH